MLTVAMPVQRRRLPCSLHLSMHAHSLRSMQFLQFPQLLRPPLTPGQPSNRRNAGSRRTHWRRAPRGQRRHGSTAKQGLGPDLAPGRAAGAMFSPHGDALDAAQLAEADGGGQEGEDGAPDADAPEAEVRLLDEVLQVHAVEGRDEGARRQADRPDREFEVEEHERVAVGIEDGFDAVGEEDVSLGNVDTAR